MFLDSMKGVETTKQINWHITFVDPRTKANDCFHVVFPKVDISLTNELV